MTESVGKVKENKPEIITQIMTHMDTVYKSKSGLYKSVERGLDKLAMYELTTMLLMLETSKQ